MSEKSIPYPDVPQNVISRPCSTSAGGCIAPPAHKAAITAGHAKSAAHKAAHKAAYDEAGPNYEEVGPNYEEVGPKTPAACPRHIPKDAEIVIRIPSEGGGYTEYALGLADLAASLGRSIIRTLKATEPLPARIDRALQDFEDRTTEVSLTMAGKEAITEKSEKAITEKAAIPTKVPRPPKLGTGVYLSPSAPPVNWKSGPMKAVLAVALASERLTKEGTIAIVHGKHAGTFSAKRPIALDTYETAVAVLQSVRDPDGIMRWKAMAGKDCREVLLDGTTHPWHDRQDQNGRQGGPQ